MPESATNDFSRCSTFLKNIKCRSICLGSYIRWDTKKHVEIIKRDEGPPTGAQAKTVATELITNDKVQILTGVVWTPNALAIAPDFVEALNNRGNALLQLDRLEEALATFDGLCDQGTGRRTAQHPVRVAASARSSFRVAAGVPPASARSADRCVTPV